jgi:hypothetical protein
MPTLGDDPDSNLEQETLNAPILETVLRAAISMRGHLVAALTTMREMAEAAKNGDLQTVKRLRLEVEALIAENQMLGVALDRTPSIPLDTSRVSMEDVEAIFGAQRTRLAARVVNRDVKEAR